jgi:hypothetical protein
MTATPEQDARAAQTQAAGEAAAAAHLAAAQAQHQVSGSSVAVEAPATSDDVAVNWTSSVDTSASPTLSPSEPRPIGEYGNHGPPDAA